MATEYDERRIAQLRAVFADPASNVPEFTRTALYGGHRRDTGILTLLEPHTPSETVRLLKSAIVQSLDAGCEPTLEQSQGDHEMGIDASQYYHFRVEVVGVRVFVKAAFDEYRGEAEVVVVSVKRDDQAWS